jgi:hypothetical protein
MPKRLDDENLEVQSQKADEVELIQQQVPGISDQNSSKVLFLFFTTCLLFLLLVNHF